jgi:hypothetical protein
MLYKRGDVIDCFPDGPLTGPPVQPHWAIIQVAGLRVERAKEILLRSDYEATAEGHRLLRRRLRTIDWALLPTQVQNTLLTQRVYTTTLAAVRQFVRNTRTDAVGEL